jgi:type VI secretion system protein ImpC
MRQWRPTLKLRVDHTLVNDNTELFVDLEFRSIRDFEPGAIVQQVLPLRQLLDQRQNGGVEAAPEEPEDASGGSLLDQILARSPDVSRGAPTSPVAQIDQKLSRQVAAILHHPDFQRLEGSWRGLHHLVMQSETSAELKLKVLPLSRAELSADLNEARQLDDSEIFQRLYAPLCDDAGEPITAVVADFEFSNLPGDIALLTRLAEIGAQCLCPVLTAASAGMFQLRDYDELPTQRLELQQSPLWIKWRALRDKDEARFLTLTLPRVLARLPYGASTRPIEEFSFEEFADRAPDTTKLTWMNSAYALAARLADAMAKFQHCSRIVGPHDGRVENLPVHSIQNEHGISLRSPAECCIDSKLAAQLASFGFMPLATVADGETCFLHGVTAAKSKAYSSDEATLAARIAAELPCVLATSRLLHWLVANLRHLLANQVPLADAQALLTQRLAGVQQAQNSMLLEGSVALSRHPKDPSLVMLEAKLRPLLPGEQQLPAPLRMVVPLVC